MKEESKIRRGVAKSCKYTVFLSRLSIKCIYTLSLENMLKYINS